MSTNTTALHQEETPAAAKTIPVRQLADFWPRFWAFSIDLILVGLAYTVVWLLSGRTIERTSPYAILLKLGLTLPYFTILNSRIGDGQTI